MSDQRRRSNDFARSHRRRSSRPYGERTDPADGHARLLVQVAFEQQLDEIRYLIASPHVHDGAREWLQRLLDGIPPGVNACLGLGTWRTVQRISLGAQLRARGVPPQSPEKIVASAKKRKKERDLYKAARKVDREENPRPQWMNDPSLLPKKPPGRAWCIKTRQKMSRASARYLAGPPGPLFSCDLQTNSTEGSTCRTGGQGP